MILSYGPFQGTVSQFGGIEETHKRYAIIFFVLVKIETGDILNMKPCFLLQDGYEMYCEFPFKSLLKFGLQRCHQGQLELKYFILGCFLVGLLNNVKCFFCSLKCQLLGHFMLWNTVQCFFQCRFVILIIVWNYQFKFSV